jgi:predicted permease
MSDRRAFGERLLRLANLAHPPAFRSKYHDEMLAYYRQASRAGGGWWWRLRFLSSSVLAALGQGWQQRRNISEARTPRPGPYPAGLGDRRSVRGVLMSSILQDVNLGLRLVRVHRGFSLVVVLTLATGLGLSTALFSVVHAALLRPLPFADPDQLVTLSVRRPDPERGFRQTAPSVEDLRAWREDGRVVSHIGAERGARSTIVDAGEPQRLRVQQVTEDYFEVFGIQPIMGRSLTEDDLDAGAPLVALVGYQHWKAEFGADPEVIGRAIRIAGTPATIVGVLPRGFHPDVAIWQQIRWGSDDERWWQMRGSGADVVARLRDGVTLETAREGLSQTLARLAQARGRRADVSAWVDSLYAEAVSGKAASLRTLSAAVIAILLIACVNVAGLLLARGANRRRELAVRASLGASRLRLVRQLLTESLVLALAGGLAGVLLAWLTLDSLLAIIPLALPGTAVAELNPEVLAFALVLSVTTALTFGIVPGLLLSRAAGAPLAASDGRVGGGLSRRGGQMLIAVEVALAVVLLAGAGLMVRSFARLASVDLGFEPKAFMTMEVAPADPSTSTAAEFYPALVEAVRRLPEVESVGAGNQLPIGGSRAAGFISRGDENIRIDERLVLPGYFESMDLAPIEGRLITEADRMGRPVVVINQRAAEQLFPDGTAVGRPLEPEAGSPEVVGVVPNWMQDGALSPVRANVYFPYRGDEDVSRTPLALLVKPRDGASDLAARLRDVARSIGPPAVVDRIQFGDAWVTDSVTTPRHRMLLLGLLGTVGLVLTMVGVFSVTAFAVARRTREIGVRIALGARSTNVVGTVLRDALWPMAVGLAVGLAGALLATRAVASFLFETEPHDPVALAGAAVVLAAGGTLATWIPARRAATVDPVVALRTE